ncbi:MAG: mechanosensitive ion channel family protein [Candidatus Altiarchaeota archaeon]
MEFQTVIDLFLPYMPNIIGIVITLLVTHILLRSTGKILFRVHKHFNIPYSHYLTVRTFVRAGIYLLTTLIVIMFIPGVNQQILALVGIGLGVLVSLSSTTTIGNAVAGTIIYITRPIREGDRVEIGGGAEGDVVSLELLFVHIKTIKDEIVSIPSLMVLNNRIVNYSQLDKFIIHVDLSLGYDLDPGDVEKLLIESAKATDGILEEPEPFVLITSLDDYNVKYEVNGYSDKPQSKVKIETDLRYNIISDFTRCGVQIMSPAFINIKNMIGIDKVIPEHVTCPLIPSHFKKPDDVMATKKEMVEAKKKLEEKKKEDIKMVDE